MKLAKLHTLRNKLIFSFLAVALTPLVLLASIAKYTTQETLTNNAHLALFAVASQTATSIDTFITTNLNNVRVEALLPGLAKYLSLPAELRSGSLEEKVSGDTLRSLSRRDNVNIFSYALLDLQGRNVLDTYTSDIGKNEFNRDYFQQPLKTGLPYVSTMRLSSTVPGLVNIYFSGLVRNAKGVVGILRVCYNATAVQQLITQKTGLAGLKSFAILLDEHYIRLAHGNTPELTFKSVMPLSPALVKNLQAQGRLPNLPTAELSTNLPALKQGLDNASHQPYLTTRLEGTGNELNAVAIAPLKNQPWFVLFTQPQAVFLAPIEAQTRTALLLAIFMAIAVIIVAAIAGNRLAKPIIYLTKTVAQFTDGNLNVRVRIESKTEITNLANSFNKMAENIQNYTESLELKNAALSQAEAQLRESEKKLTQFLEAVSVGVMVLDPNGKPYYVNQRAQQLLGKGLAPDATREQLTEVYQVYIADTSDPYPPEKMPGMRALRGESSSVDDVEIRQPDKTVPIEVWGTPIYGDRGNIAYGIVAFQDITDRKLAETERRKFIQELYQFNLAYERFVPRQFLQLLKKSSIIDVELGDRVQLEMSVLFSDIRHFTTLSERMTPEENFKFINSYLSRMEPAITENQGFIDKYLGDAIMALFSGEADNAVKAGISMLHSLVEYNQHRANSGYPPIQIGIGINTGSLMLGTVGGQNRMDGTVISDAVNLASRVEGLTKNYGVALLITEQTYSRLTNPSNYAIRTIDTVKVKGKSQFVTVYEIFDADRSEIKAGKLSTLQIFTEALSFYNLQAFGDALPLFQDCLRINPRDTVAQIYLERCQQQRR